MRCSSPILLALLLAACSPGQERVTDNSEQDRADLLNNCSPARVMLILDRSSSMQTGTINGETKWNIATNAIDAVTARFQDNLLMGLMAFPMPAQCAPGETLVQPAFGNRAAIASKLADPPPNAGNWTPMAETLAAAQQEPSMLPNSGPGARYAVLVTDGWQWCSPYDASTRFDAVDRVQELRDQGVTTFVVGFGDSVDAKALGLMAIAAGTEKAGCDPDASAAGNTCYFQADSPLELQDALEQIVVTITGESCDGLDNDCDGLIDENLSRGCSSNCGAGTETCVSGQWQGCDAPPEELDICDGLDNDCDGLTDPDCECLPGMVQSCGSQLSLGSCHAGTQECDPSGHWSPCFGEIGPIPEACNQLDDDCNGTVDDVSDPEICDGIDNDCDGQVDENLVQACSSACGLGQETCQDGSFQGCNAPPVLPDICDGLDNDCDGIADNDCDCVPGDTMVCGDSDEGECSRGVQTCDDNGFWGSCEGDRGPSLEICDGLDNDCDGAVDESNGAGVPDENDDVTIICPTGDDQPEPPSQSDDPPPPSLDEPEVPARDDSRVSQGCSVGSDAGSASWLLLALGALLLRRRHEGQN